MSTDIQQTGSLRAWGWPLMAVGAVLIVMVFPLFTLAGALRAEDAIGPVFRVIGIVAPWLGFIAIGTGITLVVMASKRAAANREAVQRAALARR